MSFAFNQSLAVKIDKVIKPLGFECIELLITSDKVKSLKLYIDFIASSNTTVTVDDCAAVSRLLGDESWFEDSIHGAFNLEVSSPGVDRPLRFARHFKRFVGETVKMQLREKVQDRWKGSGVLESIDEKNILSMDTEQGQWSFPVDVVQKANVVFNWSQS